MLKCLDVLSQTDAAKKADRLETLKCKANYDGSAPSMKTEGIKKILPAARKCITFSILNILVMMTAKHIMKLNTFTKMFSWRRKNV